MRIKQYLAAILLIATTTAGCTHYPTEAASNRSSNEAIARKLYAPLEQYFADYKTYPEQLSSLVPKYITKLPTTADGNDFQYRATPVTRKQKTSFSIYWYQRNLRDNKIIACSVARTSYKSGETSETNDCWKPRKPDH